MNIPQFEVRIIVLKLPAVHAGLVIINIVCPNHFPARFFKSKPHQADSGKELGYCSIIVHEWPELS